MYGNSKIDTASAVHWQVGEAVMTSLSDGYVQLELGTFLKNLPLEDGVAIQRRALRGADFLLEINTYLVRSDRHGPILIDCGLGSGVTPTAGRVAQALSFVGLEPKDIETVLLTHLHGDHVFGLVDVDGNAVFENATVVLHRAEAHYWLEQDLDLLADRQGAEGARRALLPYADRIVFRESGEVAPGIEMVPLPGHTPGHAGYRVGNGSQSILVWGDIVGLPHVQSKCPEAGFLTDYDGAMAVETRRIVLGMAADEGLTVAGMHIEYPGVANVIRDGSGFRLVPAQWIAHQ
jgi:glyoxylase-like metal-dependent hydrolase (beta-lactamase superfamily II)